MVGRFIEQQDVGIGHERTRQRHALALATGHLTDNLQTIELKTLDHRLKPGF